MTAVAQRVGYGELYSATRSNLRVWPHLSVAISGPDIDIGKLLFDVLELTALLHGFDVEQFEILNVNYPWFAIYQQKPIVGVSPQRICDPRKGDWT